MTKHNTFIGMDVHKNSIDIAIADEGRKGQVRHYGKIDGTLSTLDKVVRKLVSTGNRLHFVYEAGPCGYQIYRHLSDQGFDCDVVAPSRIPKPSGNQIKNDRRDALMLARLHRSGNLTAVYVPRAEDEAIRDLTRAREDVKNDEKRSKHRLLSFLLRSGIRYTGGSPWSIAHMRWLSDIKMPHQSQQVVLQEYIGTVNQCKERAQRLTEQIQQLLPEWQLYPIVQALQSMRGVSTIVAATTVAEIGDLKRFQTPSELMSYLGLVPSEHSSGPKTKRGPITKAGNGHVRRVLTEAAWAYRLPARVSRALLKRQEGLPESVCDISWKAQLRLCSRYRRLWNKGKAKQVVVTAIARELCGFMWAIANEIEVPANN
ncbi:IS110 family transposase [Desulfosarcina widdelii]|uniref:IS110 family transposase n=1 Tax=Desulfosarcina widdelii TaxID=947919 RepID=A0A5K7YXR4_9BACT|nr:IS110 family transposase [Desulfosarcina widdelii]BBO72723.1 IS110 family transposase [Desulfosarcina widdelii]BBO73676.1 IS110 family transposase [Desulfosarcina widdelii]BBO74256.1 IS110 family transposase [Desulfosarcina widdelii]